MGDAKTGREKQADDEERRQQERELQETLDRADEPEPIDSTPSEQLGDLDEELVNHNYPTTTNELVKTYSDREIETRSGTKTIEEVLAPIGNESYRICRRGSEPDTGTNTSLIGVVLSIITSGFQQHRLI